MFPWLRPFQALHSNFVSTFLSYHINCIIKQLSISITYQLNKKQTTQFIPILTVINMSKFCANLSFMFLERPFLERYKLAKEAGFKAVESGFPFGCNQEDVIAAKNAAGVQQVLINVFTGDVTKGELGFAALPGKEKEFAESIDTTINLAKSLGAKKIHVLSGRVEEVTPNHDLVYESNLRYAAKRFESENVIGVIEPINRYSVPSYYLNSYCRALDVIKEINSPNIRLLLDLFHMQHICGNITHTVSDLIQYTGHVQIAQVPNRNEPDTNGEVNYQYVLEMLEYAGYNDWIGLEYKPIGNIKDGLKWIQNFGYSL